MKEIELDLRSEFNERYNLVTRKMVRLLSENSRASISEISKAVSMSRKTVVDRIRKMEEEFRISYTVEFNESALGLVSPHLICVKFDSKPDYAKVTKLLGQSYIPQFAVATKGQYDLIIYAVGTFGREYARWDKNMQILIGELGGEWRSSEVVHRQLGFLPLRNELLDRVEMPQKYRDMLKILNSNSRTSFQEMSKTLGMHFNTVAYNFNKLLKTNYLKRFTITMDKPKDVTLMTFFSKYRPTENYEKDSAKSRRALQGDDENSLISRFLMTAPLIGTYDFFTMGAYDNPEAAYKHDVLFHKQVMEEEHPRIIYATIDSVIFGRLPIRSVDTKKEYNLMKWDVDLEK